MNHSFINWSGGKDAAFSLFKMQQNSSFSIDYLLTNVSASYDRISMHGVRKELLLKQAHAIGIPLQIIYLPEQADMQIYNRLIEDKLMEFSKKGIRYAIFGDIFLEDLRKYREEQLSTVGVKAVFPLWKKNTTDIIKEFLDAGFKAIITCVNARLLNRSFAGREISLNLLNDLPVDVDPCGENGEFHSFVFDGPVFKNPVKFVKGEIIERTYPVPENKEITWDNRFYFCDLLPLSD
ncbi:MAG: diphthine--ammonia ligase [Chitinophagaceae bacterium]